MKEQFFYIYIIDNIFIYIYLFDIVKMFFTTHESGFIFLNEYMMDVLCLSLKSFPYS